MSVTPSALPNATKTSRGALAPGAQDLPAGPKTLQDLLKLAGDWSHTIDPGGGPFELDGEPLELGDLSTGTYADLASKPGLRRYTVDGTDTYTLLGTLTHGIEFNETAARTRLIGTVSDIDVEDLLADELEVSVGAAVAGTVLISASGVTIAAGAEISSDLGTINDLSVVSLTINGDPYVRRLVDSVDTTTGLDLTTGVLSLALANGAQPGAVSNTTQTFNGEKTFAGLVNANSGLTVSGTISAQNLAAGAATLVLSSTLNVASASSNVVAVRTPGITFGALDATTRLFSVQSDSGIGGWTELHAFTKSALLTSTIIAQVAGIADRLTLRSALGATSTDVVTTAGSSVADGSVHASARLFSVRTGLGATEVDCGYFTKSALVLRGELSFSRILRDTSALGIWGVSSVGNGGTLATFETLNNLTSGTLVKALNFGAEKFSVSVTGVTKATVNYTNATFSTATDGLIVDNLGGASSQTWLIFRTGGTNRAGIRVDNGGSMVADATGDFYVMRGGTTRVQVTSTNTAVTGTLSTSVAGSSITQDAFTNCTLNTTDGWAHSANPLRYRKLSDGNVQLQGWVTKSNTLDTTGTNNDIVSAANPLPAGYRADVSFVVACGGPPGSWARISIDTTGIIQVWEWAAGGSPASVSFLYVNCIYAPTA